MEKKKYYIGLACTFHDSAIAILDGNGKVLFAEGTERSLQTKRASGMVCDERENTMRLLSMYCMDGTDFVISYSWSKPYLYKLMIHSFTGILKLKRNIAKLLLQNIQPSIANGYDLVSLEYLQLISVSQAGISFNKCLTSYFPKAKVKNVYHPHHLTHAAYGCYTSPFSDGACIVMDGFGENGSYSIYSYLQNKIQPFYLQKNLGSLGYFYALLTRLCGFDSIKGEEWKVMGLASYGNYQQQLYWLFKSMIKVKGYTFKFPLIRPWLNALQELSQFSNSIGQSPEARAQLAHNGQQVFSETMIELFNAICNERISQNIIYTGGCALNSSFNGQILKRTNFKNLYVPPAPADDGNALGAALLSYYGENPSNKSNHKNHSPYLGSSISNTSLGNFLKYSKVSKVSFHPKDICEITADILSEGKLVGWVQGCAEFGPRALGNRSILADPRPSTMKDKINSCIKFREEFRPFAPSILHEYGNYYFADYTESPYMERTQFYKKEVLNKVPAVVHVDNSGRAQSVKKESNLKFYKLIHSFFLKTGIPLVLNTSFNIMGKPMIHTIEDAMGVFYTSGLDALVIDDYLIEK